MIKWSWMLWAAVIWNCLAFLVMGWDKRRAKTGGWRTPEKVLFFFAFCFGGPGIWLGMRTFRHKTKHRSFLLGVPAGILADCALVWLLLSRI